MCVCFEIKMLDIFLVKRCFWEVKMLFGSLVDLLVWLHSYLCFSLLKKLFLSNLDSSLTPSLSIELFSCFLSQSWHLSIARLINRETFYPINSSSTATFIHRGLLDTSRSVEILLHVLFFTCFAPFLYLVIHSILFHHMHAFIWILCTPLIIFMFLGWSFITSCTLCQSWQKGEEIVETLWFLF